MKFADIEETIEDPRTGDMLYKAVFIIFYQVRGGVVCWWWWMVFMLSEVVAVLGGGVGVYPGVGGVSHDAIALWGFSGS